jgi:hypothetical protein
MVNGPRIFDGLLTFDFLGELCRLKVRLLFSLTIRKL